MCPPFKESPKKAYFSEIKFLGKNHVVLEIQHLQPSINGKVVHQWLLQDITSQKRPHHLGLSHNKVLKKDSCTM